VRASSCGPSCEPGAVVAFVVEPHTHVPRAATSADAALVDIAARSERSPRKWARWNRSCVGVTASGESSNRLLRRAHEPTLLQAPAALSHPNDPFEEMVAVLRPWRSLGMILYGDPGAVLQAEAFVGAVE
jgi:hypothetical protein